MIDFVVGAASLLSLFMPGYLVSLAFFRDLDNLDRWLFSFAFSILLIGGIMSFLASFGKFEFWKTASVLTAVCAASLSWIYVKKLQFPSFRNKLKYHLPKPNIIIALVCVFSFLSFYHALVFPETSWDALSYHLPFSETLYKTSEVPLDGNLFYNQPHGMHFLNAWLYQWNGFNDFFARLLPPLFGFASIGLVYSLGRKFFDEKTAQYSALFLSITPLFIAHAQVTYVNLPEAFFGLMSLFFIYFFLKRGGTTNILAGGLFAGFATVIKQSALFIVPVALAILFIFLRKKIAKPALIFVIAFALVSAPWYLRTFQLHGNPLYPYSFLFLTGIVGSASVPLENAVSWLFFDPKITYSFGNGPILITFGIIGLLCLRRRFEDKLLFIYFILSTLTILAFLRIDGRFFLPVLLPAAIFAGVGLSRLMSSSVKMVKTIATAVLVAEILFAFCFAVLGFKMQESYDSGTKLIIPYPMSSDAAMQKRFGGLWDAWKFIEQNTAENQSVAVVAYPRQYYYHRTTYVFGEKWNMQNTLDENQLGNDLNAAVWMLKSLNIKYILEEKRVYHSGDIRADNIITKNLNNTEYFAKTFEKEEAIIYEIK